MIHSVSMTSEYAKNSDLLRESYSYELPIELIAKRPVAQRDQSRLLVYRVSTDEVIHTNFHQISNFIPSNSTIVFNDSKVFPCRLLGHKSTGGKVEVFFLSLIN